MPRRQIGGLPDHTLTHPDIMHHIQGEFDSGVVAAGLDRYSAAPASSVKPGFGATTNRSICRNAKFLRYQCGIVTFPTDCD
jgi:hypothetical protein